MLTCVWSGIFIKEFWHFSCGMYSMKVRFQISSCLNLAVRVHSCSLGTKFWEIPPILSKMTLSHVPSCLWHTFTFNLYFVVWCHSFDYGLDLDSLCCKQVLSTMVVCDRKFLLLIMYWWKLSLTTASMTLDVHLSAFMVPCEHRTWNVKAH
jgi:hypothetical protein